MNKPTQFVMHVDIRMQPRSISQQSADFIFDRDVSNRIKISRQPQKPRYRGRKP